MLRAHFTILRDRWNLHRLRVARRRLDYLLDNVPRYWTAGVIGGGSSNLLGRVTFEQAREKLFETGERIAHVEKDWAFIALRPNESADDGR